ncbi:unnamed protein product [Macrosiphum euphorbiae]|uniref:Uncharacterized protein n=1 Tax=Macrosiphum euphorbiae TaxID=13131 RepID=A0AAV0X4N4_9HEMI|nr:unnamed protein product [Macrosiphum euphorbiae]
MKSKRENFEMITPPMQCALNIPPLSSRRLEVDIRFLSSLLDDSIDAPDHASINYHRISPEIKHPSLVHLSPILIVISHNHPVVPLMMPL